MPFNYLVTIKPNSHSFCSIADLRRALASARETYRHADWYSESSCELDPYQVMHLHTMVMFPNNISLKKHTELFKFEGFRIHFKKIPQKDRMKAYDYCLKEKQSHFKEEQSSDHFYKKTLSKLNLFKSHSILEPPATGTTVP